MLKSNLLRCAIVAAILQPAGTATIYAQQEPQAVVEEVVVTGSRIRRSDYNTPTPTVSVDAGEIDASGSTELSEVLLDLPAISSATNSSNSQTGVQRAGLDTVDLRNLGANRTLTLIDGRRAVSNRANSKSVSLSTIPSGFIERVEVTTGGASAIYGSEAIAGVVNIITESSFDGLEIKARSERNTAGDNDEYRFDAKYGTDFANDRGYFLISGSFEDREGILATDRELFTRQLDFDYDDGINEFEALSGGDEPADTFPPNIFSDLSDDIPGGNFENEDYYFDENNNLQADLNQSVDGFNTRVDDTVLIPRERLSVASKLKYELSDSIEAFGQIMYNELDTLSQREARGQSDSGSVLVVSPDGFTSQVTSGRIPIDNPFAEPFPEIIDAGSSSGIDFDRRFDELGIRENQNSRKTLRSAFGIRGTTENDWDWETSFAYGRYSQDQVRTNNLNILNLREGLDAIRIGDDIVCANEDARAAGCVAINLFGRGSITPEMADYLREDVRLEAEIEQKNLAAYITGDLMELPAGTVGIAFGGEFREDSQSLVGDEISNRGGFTASPVPDFDARISVTELFVETSIPLLADQTLAENLTLDLSARIADYDIDNVGTVLSYTAGLQWAITDDLRFRGQYSRAQRAPDMAELFSPPRGDSDTVTDICDGVTEEAGSLTDESESLTVADNCRATPGIANFFALNPGDTFSQEDDGISGPNSGNRDLFEETADTFTAGFVYSPGFIEGLRVSVDYYDISIDDAIDALSGFQVQEQCFTTVGLDSEFCGDIQRGEEGQLEQVINRQLNLNNLSTSGVDVAANYDFEIGALPGEFKASLKYSTVHDLTEEFTGPDGLTQITESAGFLDDDSFDDRAIATLAWEKGDFRVRWKTTYYGPVEDSFSRLERYREDLADDPTIQEPLFLFIDSVIYHDVYARYTFDVGENRLRLAVGVNDIFDEASPLLPSVGDVDAGSSRNFDSNYKWQGRSVYAEFRLRF